MAFVSGGVRAHMKSPEFIWVLSPALHSGMHDEGR